MLNFILSRIGIFFTESTSQTITEAVSAGEQTAEGTIPGWYRGIIIGGIALILFIIVCIIVNAKKPPQQFKKNHRDMPAD